MPGTKSNVSDHEFLYLAVKLSPQVSFDFQKVGDAIGITKHSAYCRWLSIKKKFDAEAAKDAKGSSATPEKTTKRKQSTPNEKKGSTSYESGDEEQETPTKKAKSRGKKGPVLKKEVEERELHELSATDGLLGDVADYDVI